MAFEYEYDQEVDAAYFRISNNNVLDSEEIADGIIVDYDENENIVGVELLGVKTIDPKNFDLLIPKLSNLAKAHFQALFPPLILS